jgi:hypothetical protein
MAARKLGMTSVPVVELADLTPDQRRAYVQPNSRRLRPDSIDLGIAVGARVLRVWHQIGNRPNRLGGLSRYYHREAA